MACKMSLLRGGVPGMSNKRIRYVKPYDSTEKHIPGFNYCGPGTNVWRRLREKVEPIDELDEAAKRHDLVTEPRGPFTSKGDPRKLRAADKRLRNTALRLSMPWSKYPKKDTARAVVFAMEFVL